MFTPTQEDVARYRRLRAASRALNSKLTKTIPRETYEDVGLALDIMRNGALVFDSESMTSVLADCCLFEWYEDGENLVQRYAERKDAGRSEDERYLLDAYQRSVYRILVVQSKAPGAGLQRCDVLNNEALFVMDIAASQGGASRNAG